MRLDHIAYRVADRNKTAEFFIKAFGYQIPKDLPDGFDIQFEDGSWAKCLVLIPPEKKMDHLPWSHTLSFPKETQPEFYLFPDTEEVDYHLPPEIFISDGSTGSVVKEWVEKRDGIGGIHHCAYQVESVEDMMEFMKEQGYSEFTTEEPTRCPGLTQVFTKPSQLTGIIYEFINRTQHGFCKDNVKKLMDSTKNI